MKHDRKREAVPSISGFVYQFWQSIYRWITLKENEILFLEGAEDIDIISPKNGKATAIQIKYTKRSITLNSKDVIEAINNYWKHRTENVDKVIEYYFITTSQRGKERGKPFGDTSGLDYWESIEHLKKEIAPLKDHLLKNKDLSSEIKQYINSATDDEIRNELIKRIKWLTGSKDLKSIQELVERKVCLYGNKRNVPYQISLKVVPILLKYVIDIICQKRNRRLEYFDFVKTFDDSTVVNVPYQALSTGDQILALKATLPVITPIGSLDSSPNIQLGKNYGFMPTMLPDKCINRTDLISNLLKIFESEWILLIKGSSGTGKSVLARLLTDAEKSRWLWIDAKSISPKEIKEILFRIALENAETNRKIVINDINFGPGTEEFHYALEALLHSVYSSDGKIILTTYGELPSNIFLNMQIMSESIIDIPLLKSEEIKQLATEYGCTDNKQLDIWTKVIFARTRGHPQLGHANIKSLSKKGWPVFHVADLTKDEDIETIRRGARNKLIEQLPSDKARSFVYKLSVIGFPFRREHAIELGQGIEGLSNPGEIFDFLTGPWIEKISNTYYRLSPLLENSAKMVWGKDEIAAAQKELAETIANCGSLTLLEANIILVNGIISGTGRPVLGVITSLLSAPEKYWRKISNELDWITYIGLVPGKTAFPYDPLVNVYLRQFQYRVAIEKNDIELASKIAVLWEHELEYGQTPELKLVDRFMFLVKTITSYEVMFSQEIIISRIVELMNSEAEINKLLNVSSLFKDLHNKLNFPESLLLFSIARVKNVREFDSLLTALEKQPTKIRNRLISLLQTKNDSAEFLLNSVFLGELNKGAPNWEGCIEIIERAIEFSFSWNIKSLAIAAYRTISIIQDEQMKDSGKGLKVLDTARARLGSEHPYLANERATILYNRKRYRNALKIWNDAFRDWPHDTVFKPTYHVSYALDCAAKEGDWSKVKAFALKGSEFATQLGNAVLATAFRAECGLVLWKEKSYQESINAFSLIVDELPELSNPYKHTLSYKLQKLVGHALAWMTQEIGDRVQLAEPQIGCFSNQVIDEKIREYPLQPAGFMWYFLAGLEYKLGTGKLMLKRLEKESQILNIPFLNYQFWHIKIGHSLRDLDLKNLISDFEKWYRNFNISRKHVTSGKSLFEKIDTKQTNQDNDNLPKDSQLIPLLILGALIKFVNIGKYSNAPVAKWKADAKRLQFLNFDDYFQFIQNAPKKSTEELIQLMKEGKTEIKCIAALNISSRELIKPLYRLYADLTLVNVMKVFPWIEAVEIDFEQMTSRNWKKVASQQSFALSAPRINIPIIEKACSDLSKGLKKVAKILMAVKNAVQLSIPDVELNNLKELANKK